MHANKRSDTDTGHHARGQSRHSCEGVGRGGVAVDVHPKLTSSTFRHVTCLSKYDATLDSHGLRVGVGGVSAEAAEAAPLLGVVGVTSPSAMAGRVDWPRALHRAARGLGPTSPTLPRQERGMRGNKILCRRDEADL